VFLHGFPGSGKTFNADYLATLGWNHIDGDQNLYSEDENVRNQWAGFAEIFGKWGSGKDDEITED